MAFKDLCLIFISKRMQKSPWVGVQRKHTLRREAASLHQAAVGAGWAWGTTPWRRSGGEAGAAARGPAWLLRSVPQAGGLSGPLGFGGGLFHCHWPGKHTRLSPCLAIVRVTVPQGSCSMSWGNNWRMETSRKTLWGHPFGAGQGAGERERAFAPGWRGATALAAALGGSSLLDSRPPKPP